jgi:hypothetical protein
MRCFISPDGKYLAHEYVNVIANVTPFTIVVFNGETSMTAYLITFTGLVHFSQFL